jgi:hypothetical protein
MSAIVMVSTKRGKDSRTGEIGTYTEGSVYENLCPELKVVFLQNGWAKSTEEVQPTETVAEESVFDGVEDSEEVTIGDDETTTSDDEVFEALDKMNKTELADFAAKQGISVDKTKSKAELLKDVKTGYLNLKF